MNNSQTDLDQRGGGDRGREDTFRYAPRNAHYAFAALAGLGAIAIAIAVFDVQGVRETGEAFWLVPAGTILIFVGLGLYAIMWRKPALLVIGPDGLFLPIALAKPIAWGEIWRISHARQRISWFQEMSILKVELTPGLEPSYKRSPIVWPLVDGLIARKLGLRIPLQSLDADDTTILASVERFRPVTR